MSKIILQEISKTSEIEILGHKFDGLNAINQAVESFCRFGRNSWNITPKCPVEGIYVACVYEPYPCFDSYDYAGEDRDFKNYFFSTQPFTETLLRRLSMIPKKCNARIVSETMPEWAVPAIYYGGDGDKIIVATLL
ncbi:MAG: hypothetical protein ACI30R_07095 [Sodaliphilus sp.]